MDLDTRLWLAWNKARFLMMPPEQRIRLEVGTDGRHLTYLLVSLHKLGYGIHVVESPMLFRELCCLRRSTPIPCIIGGRERECHMSLSDRKQVSDKADRGRMENVVLDYDIFCYRANGFQMPYFMHPSVYYEGFHDAPEPNVEGERPARLGFFGTRDADFYMRHFHFPMMNREEILEIFFEKFNDQMETATQNVSSWRRQNIVVSLDDKGGDRPAKSFLPQREYLRALHSCDFFLSPPGWCIPLSHNLIEGMAAGSIPIINSGDYLRPRLKHEVNCLLFSTPDELTAVVKKALTMSQEQVMVMRRNVVFYYEEHLYPGRWLVKALERGEKKILINAEEHSLKSAAFHAI